LRTLVISDLHLGGRAQYDVLRRPAPLARLLETLDGVDRLVLLGDLIELITRQPRRSLLEAKPILSAIGRRMAGGQVVVVPGNHDAPLIRAWAREQGDRLTIATQVDAGASRALTRVVSWLGPAAVHVHYPGVWLSGDVFATHGHYLDHHLIPESPIGLPRGPLRPQPHRPATPSDYEHGRIRSHHTRDTVAGRPLALLADATADLARKTILARLPQLLHSARLTPVSAAIVDLQMRRAALPAMRRVLELLEIRARWVIFGHVHRLGPLAVDRQWSDSRLVNTGSWLYEPALIDRATPPHPYWPGGAVLIEPEGAPRVVSLLDDLDRAQLLPG
jgi:UDP-2,3-diacylglucosamine pyrophosphatase LpxH